MPFEHEGDSAIATSASAEQSPPPGESSEKPGGALPPSPSEDPSPPLPLLASATISATRSTALSAPRMIVASFQRPPPAPVPTTTPLSFLENFADENSG